MQLTWGLASWRLYEYILIDITLLSDISNWRINPSFRIYFHLHIFDQQHIRADVTRNIATTPSPNVIGHSMAGQLFIVTHLWMHLPVESFTSIFFYYHFYTAADVIFSKNHEVNTAELSKKEANLRELRRRLWQVNFSRLLAALGK